ncbi:RNA polymerase sigma factor [Streptomyces niveus]|uniref:RNA polymerase sigma factor n=1 Tax=Streptomyces niveus TaxID=193462 RepID=UPI00386C0866
MTTELRARIRDGDPDAFAEIFDSYARAVYNHAYRLTADWSVAEDVMSETFMAAWRMRERADADGGSLRPWLLGVATNVARNHLRSNRRYRAAATAAATDAERGALEMPDHAGQVAGQLDDRRRLAATMRALASLRPLEREVLVLCLWEGMRYDDAATALDIPVGTVRSRLSRARKKLAKRADAELVAEKHVAGKLVTGKREPVAPTRQVRGDRATAVRSAREGNR